EAGREAELARRRGVGRESIESAGQRGRVQIRLDLRVVHAVAAADRGARIAVRMPAEAEARLEILLRVGERLALPAQAGVEGEVAQMDAVLHERGVEVLRQFVTIHAEIDRLRVLLHVGERELIERLRRRVLERERAEDRGAGLGAETA